MTTSTRSFNDTTIGPLDFTNDSVLETDTGPGVIAFTSSGSMVFGAADFGTTPVYQGIAWSDFNSGVVGNSAGTAVSQTLSINYELSAGAGGSIFGLDGIIIGDLVTAVAGVTLNAVETVTDASGNTVATLTWNYLTGSQGQWLSTGYSDLNVNLTITASIAGGASTAGEHALFSGIEQGFVAGSVTLDKQVSVDGTTWYDVGSGVLNDPTTLAGGTVYYRVIVTNDSTDSLSLAGAGVTDTNGPSPFTFDGGQTTFNLAAGGTITSDVITTTAVAGYELDTATLTGVFTDNTHTATLSASDTADYTGLTGAIAIDKQVSVDGSTWYDVGSGVLNDPSTFVGDTVYYRVLVSNGSSAGLAINGASVSDLGGPAFTFGGASSTTIAAGATATSDIETATAASGYHTDTATVAGTVTAGGHTATLSASDTADYTGLTGAIAIDKQVSVDGSTWYDVGSGVLNDPSTFVGDTVYYRVLVSNGSSAGLAINGASVSDLGGPAFTFGGASSTTIAAGATATSDIETATAASGYHTDTATVAGTVTAGGHTATLSASDTADYTGLTGAIAIDKQVSVDGSTWYDVGSGVLNDPSTFVGDTVYYRVLVSNGSSAGLAINGASVSDLGGPAFTFGGASSTTIAAGATATSDIETATAASGYHTDTATVAGTVTAGGQSETLGASDSADYTGLTGAIAIDKQVSVDGSTWYDVGSGVLNDPSTFVGDTVYYRVLVSNGSSAGLAINGASVSDLGGPAFTFGGASSTTIAAGATATSDIETATAASGYHTDTATVAGTVTAGGQSETLGASDSADYTGLTGAIAIDKQVSVDGSTWYDVGSGVLNDPSTFVGDTVYYRVLVSNGSSAGLAINGASVSDLGGPAFTFGGASSTTIAAGATATSDIETATAASGYHTDTATVAGTVTAGGHTATLSASDTADYTGLTGAIAIDKQVSVDGSTWYDVGSGVLNDPSTFVGDTVYYRVLVSNGSSAGLAINGASVSDLGGPAFTFGGASSTTIAAGATATSDIETATAASGYHTDTATVAGTVTAGGHTATLSASDTADYTGLTGAIAIDKQVSVDGSTWYDVGSGVLNDPSTFVGDTVYYRVLVSNGSSAGLAINGASVSDLGGPAFTFGGASSTTIAAGATATSDIETATAASGYHTDTATVAGTVTAGGQSETLGASDSADYTGLTGAIAIDKQVSVDGSTWYDVGSGVLNDPSTFVGDTVYYRVLVSNGSSAGLAINGASVSDLGGPAFTFGGASSTTIAAGATATSDIETATAASGYHTDTATVAGTVTAGGQSETLGASDSADYTGLTGAIAIDKQVSVDGSTWYDVGSGVLNDPSTFVGDTVYYRVLVSNGSSAGLAINGASVSDLGGPAFTFGGASSTTIAAGATATSDIETATAASGYHTDTATVAGTVTAGGHTATLSASDTADYTGLTPQVSIDKQVSVDGSTWYDVGSGVLNDPTALVGCPVYFRVIVTNASSSTVTGAQLTDAGGPSFTFHGHTTATIAAGATVTSDVSTITAVAGHQIDTATLTGTETVAGHAVTVGASDTADYTGLQPGLTVVKVPGCVVVGNCQPDTFTFYVTNNGTAPLTNVNIVDNIGTAANPDDVTPAPVLSGGTNVGDTNHNGVLDPGETWQYTETVNETTSGASACTTTQSLSGCRATSGSTLWLNACFTPSSTANGATYVFHGISLTLRGQGGANPITEQVPDACVTFSSSCHQATTTYSASQNCWITTLPANQNCGNVFLSGIPVQVPSGCNYTNGSATWSIASSSNTCGASGLSWQTSASTYNTFQSNGWDGGSDYNQIGVQACDNTSLCNQSSWGNWSWGGSSYGNCAGAANNETGLGNCYGQQNQGCGSQITQCQPSSGSVSVPDTVTVTASAVNPMQQGATTTCQTLSNCKASSGSTLWLNACFTPPSTANGACYNFQGVSLTITGGGHTLNVQAPNACVTFSNGCTQASTVYNAQTNCWDTTVPAGQNCGNVFLSGIPVQVPSGCNLSNASVGWSIASSTNTCGAANLTWQTSASTYGNFDQQGENGCSDYNQIGVQACDNSTLCGSGWGSWYGWGSSENCAGAATDQNSSGNCWSQQSQSCGSTTICSTCASETVTATDSKEVQVLPSSSNITVNGAAPTGNLPSAYGTAEKLEFTYNAGNTVSLAPGSGTLAAVLGSNSASTAFLEISNNSNPFASGAQIYFEGSVTAGENIFADATINQLTGAATSGASSHFSTSSGAEIYAFVFANQQAFQNHAGAEQTLAYGSAGQMHLNDTIGSLKLAGYVGTSGGHLVS